MPPRSSLDVNHLNGNDVRRGSTEDGLPAATIRLAPSHGPAVSDQLSISNSVIGLVAASSQTFNDLIDLNTDPNRDTAAIDRACRAVKSFKATVNVLYKIFRRFELKTLPHTARPGFLELDVLIATLTESALVLSELGNALLDISDEAEQLSVAPTLLCHQHSETIIGDSNKIAKVDSIMTRVLSVLQVGDEFEAVRHRDQAQELVRGILDTDIDLSDRLQQMRDVFGARSLVPRERLEQVTNVAPPEYSVPVTHSEELPEYSRATSGTQNDDGSTTIRPGSISIFSGLTLADVSILSLIPLPLHSGELRYGVLYSNEYCRSVNDELGLLAEKNTKQKNNQLAKILGLRNAGSDWEVNGFARRVGLKYDEYDRRGGPRRSRPQPDLRRPFG